jgi:hypothetical protein
MAPLVCTVAWPLNRYPFRTIGSTTFTSTFGFDARFSTVPGDAMSANIK